MIPFGFDFLFKYGEVCSMGPVSDEVEGRFYD